MLSLAPLGRLLPRETADPGFPAYLGGKVALLTAYFDESEHGDKYLVVGGVVSTSDKWVCFSEDCERIKSEFGVPYVHAVKLFDTNSSRLYGHLSMPRRIDLANSLIRSIMEFTEFSIVETIIPRSFNRLMTKEWKNRLGGSYQMCFQAVIQTLHEWLCVPNHERHTVNIFVEDGHRNVGGAAEIIMGYKAMTDDDPDFPVVSDDPLLKIGGYGTLSKDIAPPLWAADLISYCMYRTTVHRDTFFRGLMDKIEERVPIIGSLIDAELVEVFKQAWIESQEEKRQAHQTVKYLGQFGVKVTKHRRGIAFDLSNATLPPDILEGREDE